MKQAQAIILATVIFLSACSSEKEKPELLKDFSMNQHIASYVDSLGVFDVNLIVKYREILSDLYKKNQYKSFWFTGNQLNPQSEKMLDLLANSMIYGLDTALYNLPAIRNFTLGFSQDTLITDENKRSMLGYELSLTQSAVLFFTQLNRGIMPFDPVEYVPASQLDSLSAYHQIYKHFEELPQDSLVNLVLHAFATDSVQALINSLQPQNIHYKRLQKALEDYVLSNPINHDSIQIIYFEKDTAWTTTFENYRKACLALQKLKWSNITPNQCIFINVPSFALDFVQENRIASSHKIIAGTVKNQTPELNSRLSQIRLFPHWNVPFSIATQEVLPMVKRNIAYLEKHNYEVLDRSGNVITPDLLPWHSYSRNHFPIRIRQTPGYHNSLGIVMFFFHNNSSVFFHDTPAKALFSRSFRAFSHGCMRTQNPLALARAIMEFDNSILHLPADTLIAMGIYETQRQRKDDYTENRDESAPQNIFEQRLQDREKYTYSVKKTIPIYIRYLTAFSDENNQLRFSPDFYGKDSLLIIRYNEAVEAIAGKWEE